MRTLLLLTLAACGPKDAPSDDSGETGGADTGDSGADSGTDTGDSGTDSGDTGDSGTDSGDTGDSGADSGDTGDTGTGDPCAPAIPSTAIVVREDTTLTEDDIDVWICRGVTASVTGTGGRYYVDDRGSLVVSGGEGVVWAGPRADIAMLAGPNELYVDPAADYRVDADDVTVVKCPAVTFDTTNAPADGC
jgi:hypothetical protein